MFHILFLEICKRCKESLTKLSSDVNFQRFLVSDQPAFAEPSVTEESTSEPFTTEVRDPLVS